MADPGAELYGDVRSETHVRLAGDTRIEARPSRLAETSTGERTVMPIVVSLGWVNRLTLIGDRAQMQRLHDAIGRVIAEDAASDTGEGR